jgi:hypothetical protein
MGNVSYLLPSIHPMIKMAPDGVAIHTEEFAHFAGVALGDSAVVTGAQAMAMTVIDLWTTPDLCAQLSSEFAQVTSDIDVLA